MRDSAMPWHPTCRLAPLLCAAVCVFLSSCQERPLQARGSPVISAGAADFDGTFATFGTWDGRVAVVVLSDSPALRTNCGTSGGTAEYTGVHRPPSGAPISWTCSTADGESGRVEINGRSYDLRRGLLFLVSRSEHSTSIRQLNRESKPETEFFEELLTDPSVTAPSSSLTGVGKSS